MEKEKKYFGGADGALNADDVKSIVGINQWVNMENCRTGTTDNGVVGTVESIGGTELISAVQPSITFLTLGSATEQARNRILYFKYNTTGVWHKIVCYDSTPGVEQEYDVLLSSQVNGGLNFNKNYPIHSAKIIDGKLYWVEGTNNQPRKINIDAAIKANNPSYVTDETAYTFPLDFSEITLIKPPPPLSPNIQKLEDNTFDNNFIANESFMFAFEYVWYDDEVTVLGTYSPSSRLNKNAAVENYIQVTMDSLERIPSSVRIIKLVVRYSNTNNAFVIKTWDKEVSSEATEIANQNSGTQVLTFDFYGNILGEAIPSSPVNKVLKPFDSVPVYSETLDAARNRLFLGGNVEGYNAPTQTSLSLSPTTIDISAATLSKNLYQVTHAGIWNGGASSYAYSAWYVYLTEVAPIGWYALTSTEQLNTSSNVYPPLPAAPASVSLAGLTFRGANQSDVLDSTKPSGGTPIIWDFFLTANNCTITGTSVQVYDVFKSGAQYQFGVVFYDFAMRKCGVVTNDGLVFDITNRNYNYTSGTDSIVWTLSNASALTEIPDWAYYYTPVRTLNLRTRFFIQSFTNAAKYATKTTDGNYQFTSNTFIIGSVGIGLNTTALVQSGLGYVYAEGDVCVLTKSDNTVTVLPVIGQDGNYIIVKAEDLGDLTSASFVFEIYTPYITTEQEPFYEMGQMYRVLNPGTDMRSYETISDIFVPDSYVLTRNYSTVTYFGEAMSPNDLFYKRWDNDGGKINYVTKLGQVSKDNSISFSNTIIPNTAINGLSTFDALDEKSLPIECGKVRKLQITSKVQDELGIVMLSICEKETASLYIGEVQQYGSTGESANIVTSEQVIGTINVLKGAYGTINPESVTEYRGMVFWADANNGRYIQYSTNGLYPISNVKMTRFWNQFFTRYKSLTNEEIEAFGGRPFIFSTVDPYHNELLISIPQLYSTTINGYMPDYVGVLAYPFDIWDGMGKTIVCKLENGNIPAHWQGSYSFNPECFVTLSNKLYSFLNGNLFIHNQTSTYNNFYGVQYKSRIMCISNQNPAIPKVYNNIALKSNLAPSLSYFYNDYPYQQSTDLVDFDYNNLEGLFYATLYRNKLIPTAIGYDTNGLLTGEKMRAAGLYVLLEFTVTTTPLELEFVSIGYINSLGQTF